ncbi:hypothetical protein EK904_001591 [Melospiza melodia maxima]|nr:hypothetical protein EK904_001591 [Melospiza melodia maxima]
MQTVQVSDGGASPPAIPERERHGHGWIPVSAECSGQGHSPDSERGDNSPINWARADGRKLVRNASFGGYNELAPALPGSDKGKDDASQKDDAAYSMSKSKSESKLFNGSEKDISQSSSKLTKKESLKVQKKNYREEKKRATKELLSTLTDPSVVVMADWLKGPKGEAVGAITLPLPSSYLIIRAASESDGRCWMDALELALKCSSLLKRTMIREGKEHDLNSSADSSHVSFYGLIRANNLHSGENLPLNDSEIERHHFKDQDTYSDKSDKENDHDHEESDNDGLGKSEESDSDTSERQDDSYVDPEPIDIKETTYLEQSHEELGEAGEAAQTEEVSEENKSLIWTLLKQVRPGMDLSKVVLPTFILEPRSFLDKLSDYYYHADFLSEAALEENAYNRMKQVVKWYLSGFYKKPKGLKKPYNPILGEFFRCMWIHPRTNSKTFYIAEQVSHHPPVSAFYVSNRKDGFCLSGSILAKSKFYGNSLSAILDGEGRLTFLNRGEDYVMTMPYAHCKGILYGTMTLELGGIVNITCEKTGYSATIEFKLKPFLGNNDNVNQISGRIKLGKEVLAVLEGHWDSEVIISDKKTGVSETFWNPTSEIKQRRLHRYTVKFEEQDDFESEKLWQQVTKAINNKDQTEATQEKYILEEAQRRSAKERKLKDEEWACKLFDQDSITGEWHYKYADTRPWDPLNDMIQFEKDGAIQTKVRHRTPMSYDISLVFILRHTDESSPQNRSSSTLRSDPIELNSVEKVVLVMNWKGKGYVMKLLENVKQEDVVIYYAKLCGVSVVECLSSEEMALISEITGVSPYVPFGDTLDREITETAVVTFCRPLLLVSKRCVHVGFASVCAFQPHCLILCGPVDGVNEQHAAALQEAFTMLQQLFKTVDQRGKWKAEGESQSKASDVYTWHSSAIQKQLVIENTCNINQVSECQLKAPSDETERKIFDPDKSDLLVHNQKNHSTPVLVALNTDTVTACECLDVGKGLEKTCCHIVPFKQEESCADVAQDYSNCLIEAGSVLPVGGYFEILLHYYIQDYVKQCQQSELTIVSNVVADALLSIPKVLYQTERDGFTKFYLEAINLLKKNQPLPVNNEGLESVYCKYQLVISVLHCLTELLSIDLVIGIRRPLQKIQDRDSEDDT